MNIQSYDILIFFIFPVFFLLMGFEILYSKYKNHKLYQTDDWFASMGVLLISILIEIVTKLFVFKIFYYLHELTPLRLIVQTQWWAWILLFLLDDFTYYWFHRKNHEVRLFWAGHVPHHSSQYMNFGTALRQGPGERIHKYFFWMWLPLLGFNPIMIFMMHSISYIYQFWIHTELIQKLPFWIEYIFNTPAHHRIHHASNARYLDRNHGGILIIWDRIFGTFSAEIKDEKLIYGLTKNIKTKNPFFVAIHDYKSIFHSICRSNSFKENLYIFCKSPQWSQKKQGPLRSSQNNQI